MNLTVISAQRRPVMALLAAALLSASALAQAPATTPGSATPSAAQRRAGTAAPKPLSASEKATLQALYTKLRPTVLRIEQCPPNDCTDPDGVGTGFLISADGVALTAYHVVQGARNLSVQTLDKKRYKVEVIGYDEQHDLAVLRVNVPANTPYLPLAGSRPAIGDALLAIGNGNGDFLLPKSGRLTGLNADAGRADFPPGTLQMSVPVIPGDSGGPILNARGEVTGVVSYISVGRRDAAAFAVPVTTTDPLLADVRAGTKRDAPVIGIGLGGMLGQLFGLNSSDFKELSDIMKLGDTPGAFFTSVSPGSPAELAGLQPLKLNADAQRISGDIVTEVDGKRIVNFSEFQYAVRSHQPGDTVTLTVLRDGKVIKVKVTLIGHSRLQN